MKSATQVYRALTRTPSDMQAHLPTLYGWVVRLRPEWVIELGVRKGNSTAALLAGLDHNRKGKLWSCDVARPRVPEPIRDHPRWHFAFGDDCHPERLNPPPPKTCDLLFIDTSHTLEHTRRELEIYGSRVKRGGIVLIHDVDESACAEAVREWSGDPDSDRTYCHGLGATIVR